MTVLFLNLKWYFVVIFFLSRLGVFAQGEDNFRLNQIGFYSEGPKTAIVITNSKSSFSVQSIKGKMVFKGQLQATASPSLSGKQTLYADFTSLKKSGRYVIQVDGIGQSYPFVIEKKPFRDVGKAAMKSYYFQRASVSLPEKHAGKWHRAAGHPDTLVLVHPSAASASRPAGYTIASPRGWYDAGDYNKYIVNSGITMGTMLSLYEDYPQYVKSLHLNIPESKNAIPDFLDELLWNIRWMLTMQDPADGGVYHKLSNPKFDGMVMPDKAKFPRYVVQKSTAATLDFAAVMAQASRVLQTYAKSLPGLSDSCINAAQYAWKWAQENPNDYYDQNKINQQFKPEISTGAYGDSDVRDEFKWAAAELYVSTADLRYYEAIKIGPDEPLSLPNWSQVKLLAYYTLFRHEQKLHAQARSDIQLLKTKFLMFADQLVNGAERNAFKTVMGQTLRDFNWGSSANAANQGVVLLQAYRLSGNEQYLNYALSNVDYILGRNATGYSYVTGFGSKLVKHPHHRLSVADGIDDPIPGFLIGGPNPGAEDKIITSSKVPDEAFVDDDCSFATNEIAINWNSPLVYLLNALEATYLSK
jgi:endoglucanase